jgi:S-DNA-T family DNA segregation ATPase FtsK/SpoIIIE
MSAPAARLEVVAGKALGMTILVEDELVIGRQAEGPGRLADDEEISRSHARLVFDARGVCAIEDLGSTNGTFLNGLRISVPRTLAEGDTIEIGATTLVLRDLPRPEPRGAAPEPPPTAPEPPRTTPEPLPTTPEPPPAAPEAAPTSGITPSSASPRNVSVRLEIDFAAREARLSLNDATEPVRLAFESQASG